MRSAAAIAISTYSCLSPRHGAGGPCCAPPDLEIGGSRRTWEDGSQHGTQRFRTGPVQLGDSWIGRCYEKALTGTSVEDTAAGFEVRAHRVGSERAPLAYNYAAPRHAPSQFRHPDVTDATSVAMFYRQCHVYGNTPGLKWSGATTNEYL
ncbi:hypothetical protein VTH06DRAFT_2269 [Thermothelomyces fergusii]